MACTQLIFASLPSHTVLEGSTGPVRADVVQTADALHITVELPGVSGDDIRLGFEPGRLVIEGQREQPVWDATARVVQMEISYGPFRRVLPLPPQADGAGISASYGNGILQVRVPLRVPVTPPLRRVNVS